MITVKSMISVSFQVLSLIFLRILSYKHLSEPNGTVPVRGGPESAQFGSVQSHIWNRAESNRTVLVWTGYLSFGMSYARETSFAR